MIAVFDGAHFTSPSPTMSMAWSGRMPSGRAFAVSSAGIRPTLTWDLGQPPRALAVRLSTRTYSAAGGPPRRGVVRGLRDLAASAAPVDAATRVGGPIQ